MSDRVYTIIMILIVVVVAVTMVVVVWAAIVNEQNAAQITSGTVVDKDYHPPYYSHTKNTTTYWPARYTITVKGDNGITAIFSVPPEKYNEVKIDDWYPNVAKALK